MNASSTQPQGETLVLAGLGHAHVFVLEHLAKLRRLPKTTPLPVLHALDQGRVVLVSPSDCAVYSGMVPGVLAGIYEPHAPMMRLQHLIAASGVRHIRASVAALDAQHGTLQLDDAQGSQLRYQTLSLNTGGILTPEFCEAAVPGSWNLALKLRPMEQLLRLWPQVQGQALAKPKSAGPYRIAVIGAGAAGLELAMAMAVALPSASVSLLCGAHAPGSGVSSGFARRVASALAQARVQVLPFTATGLDMHDNQLRVLLTGGAALACDAPVLAIGNTAPPWLQGSGLALSPQGTVLVGASSVSTSHANVFAVGDVASRADVLQPRSGAAAVRAGVPLAHNLVRQVLNQALRPAPARTRFLSLLSCGNGKAIAQFGAWSAHGAWVWHLKHHLDSQFMARFSQNSPPLPQNTGESQ